MIELLGVQVSLFLSALELNEGYGSNNMSLEVFKLCTAPLDAITFYEITLPISI